MTAPVCSAPCSRISLGVFDEMFRRRSADDAPTQAQRERLLIVMASGGIDGPDRTLTQRRLEYARELFESGAIGRDDREDGDGR